MVPLTTSLYVPGVVGDISKVLVDVGTGYFIEVRLVAVGRAMMFAFVYLQFATCHSRTLLLTLF